MRRTLSNADEVPVKLRVALPVLLALLSVGGFAQAPNAPSQAAQDATAKRLDSQLAEAIRRHATPRVLPDEDTAPSGGEVTLDGQITKTGDPFDLGTFDPTLKGLSGRIAILRHDATLAYTVTCFVDLAPCDAMRRGTWTLLPHYDGNRNTIRWRVERFTPALPRVLP
jgi:hypothetical protein